MDSISQKTLRRIELNDDGLTELSLGYSYLNGGFVSSDASDYSRLGAAIGNNTHLTKLLVNLRANQALDAANTEFFEGLKRNSSISELQLNCSNQHILVGGVEHEILKSYQKISNNLTRLCIESSVLDNGGGNVITDTLKWCTNLNTINLRSNNITDEHLLPIIDAIRGHRMLKMFILHGNRIGNAGCQAIATLLEDTNCNLQIINLDSNQIGNDGATAIANSLANNTNLKRLYLRRNPFDPSAAAGIFCRVLCNTASVNTTYRSNHTLEKLDLSDEEEEQHAEEKLANTILDLNKGTNKSHVAIRKILKYHPNIDMEPLFEWDVDGEADGEQSLKALPFVIDWFGRAEEAVAEEDRLADDEDTDSEDDDNSVSDDYDYCVDERKLSAIFQFAKAMPLLLEPISRIKVDDHRKHKRKRGEN